MFVPNKESNNIVVVFSFFSRRGIPARYNYFKTLKKYQTNKLFILDDFGIDEKGYTDHWNVSLYFPNFLKMSLDELGINCK